MIISVAFLDKYKSKSTDIFTIDGEKQIITENTHLLKKKASVNMIFFFLTVILIRRVF